MPQNLKNLILTRSSNIKKLHQTKGNITTLNKYKLIFSYSIMHTIEHIIQTCKLSFMKLKKIIKQHFNQYFLFSA